MTDQLTPGQKAVSGLVPGYFDSHGWGFGVSVITRRDDLAGPVGRFGWDGGLGTSWYPRPAEGMVAVLMTQRAWTSPSPRNVCRRMSVPSMCVLWRADPPGENAGYGPGPGPSKRA
jgi:CubicO group peptidase (beta-lactamase class C family)